MRCRRSAPLGGLGRGGRRHLVSCSPHQDLTLQSSREKAEDITGTERTEDRRQSYSLIQEWIIRAGSGQLRRWARRKLKRILSNKDWLRPKVKLMWQRERQWDQGKVLEKLQNSNTGHSSLLPKPEIFYFFIFYFTMHITVKQQFR